MEGIDGKKEERNDDYIIEGQAPLALKVQIYFRNNIYTAVSFHLLFS
jgi:hypothetical protein